jgi:hypothetical protein
MALKLSDFLLNPLHDFKTHFGRVEEMKRGLEGLLRKRCLAKA